MTEITNLQKKFFFFLNLNSSYYCPLHSAVRGACTTRLTLARPLVTPADDPSRALLTRHSSRLSDNINSFFSLSYLLRRPIQELVSENPKSPFEYHATYTWSSPLLLLLNVIHSLVLQKLHISLVQR